MPDSPSSWNCPPLSCVVLRVSSCRTPWMVFSLLSGLPLWVCGGTERAKLLALVILAHLAAQAPPGLHGSSSFLSCVWHAHRHTRHAEVQLRCLKDWNEAILKKKKIPLSSSQDLSLVSTLGTKTFPPNVPVVDGCCQSSRWHLHKIPNLIFL